MQPMSSVKEFALKEYESLREEAVLTVTETRLIERYILVATAGIWTWLVTQQHWLPLMYKLKWLPLVLSVLAFSRCVALLLTLRQMGNYLYQVEQFWGTDSAFRWESFTKTRRGHLAATAGLFWILLMVGNACIAFSIDAT